jgi:hypothetical protein
LSKWAIFLTRAGRDGGWPFAIEDLRELALEEPWEFGGKKDPANPSPILHSYLRWTFYRLAMERNKILTSPKLAAFNTGLVDNRYEPIYALFEKNPYEYSASRWPWCFTGFCTEGERTLGKDLVGAFKPLPEAPHYFNDPNSMFYDVHAGEPSLDTKHIVEDNCTRLPLAFIEDNCPRGFTPRDCSVMSKGDQVNYTREFTRAISDDSRRYRSMMNRLEDAVKTARKRARWNFKTAIPQYYPTRNEMSLLLPLALVSDERPDVALVVKKVPSGAYQGYTILPLAWAYNNARLVCRPNSDWLIPEEITQAQSEEQEGDEEGGLNASEPPVPPGEGERSV